MTMMRKMKKTRMTMRKTKKKMKYLLEKVAM